jgi:hypothetical protein
VGLGSDFAYALDVQFERTLLMNGFAAPHTPHTLQGSKRSFSRGLPTSEFRSTVIGICALYFGEPGSILRPEAC